jgi:hypothetical protein
MAVCVNFNYPRVELSTNGVGGGSTTCGTYTGSKVGLTGGGAFKPSPFTALRVQKFTGGLTTGTGRNVQYTTQVDGFLPADVPHVVEGLAVPGAAGAEGVGFYILFGQQIP